MTGQRDRRVAGLVDRFELGEGDEAYGRLVQLLGALVDDPTAPTAVRDRDRAIDDHLADSLIALELDEVRDASSFADLGSGAGLPALPLAIARADAAFTLIESARRKCEFLRRTVVRCGLSNVQVLHARAEEAARTRMGGYDVVTARALASLAVVAEYAAPLLRVGGTLVAWRGARDTDAEREAENAAAQLGLEVGEIRRVTPYRGADRRHLHLMSKVMQTPDGFPRRAGMAVKRPLGR